MSALLGAENSSHRVRVIDDLSVGSLDDLSRVCDFQEYHATENMSFPPGDQVQFIQGDIKDGKFTTNVCQDMDVIVHLAANTGVAPSVEDPELDCQNNVIGTFNMLQGAKRHSVSRFVFASSGAPIGEVVPPIHEELAPRPVSPYGASKLAGEGYCSAYYNSFGVDTVVLRFSNVYGPGSDKKQSVVAKFIKQAIINESLEVYGSGEQTRDFIFIDDLIEAIYLAATKVSIGGETFQIATNSETTLVSLIDLLAPVLERNGLQRPVVNNTDARKGDVMRNYSEINKANNLLGWYPKVELSEGLERTVQYFLNQA